MAAQLLQRRQWFKLVRRDLCDRINCLILYASLVLEKRLRKAD